MVHGSVRVAVLALLGAVAVSVWATWPLAVHLSTHVYDPTRHGGFVAESIRADVRLVVWILAWTLHALTTPGVSLWDANVFHPARGTLALSEHLLGALPVYAPLALATGDPVFAHQATLLATFVLAVLAMLALARAWTASWPAAILAASLFAFSPFRGAHLGALQIEGCWMFPVVVLAAWRSVTTPGLGWPIALALSLAMVGLHSVYLAYGAFAGLATLLAVVIAFDARARAAWRRLAFPVLAAAAVVADASRPYLAMREAGALGPPRGEFVALTSAMLGQTGTTFAVVLALLTVPWWRRGLARDVPVAWIAGTLAAGVMCHALALGPTIRASTLEMPGPYALAAAVVPGFAALRIPSRLNAFATACAALLAGAGAAGLARSISNPHNRARVAILSVALAFSAARVGLPSRVPLEPIETRATLPPVYQALAAAAPGPVLELPWHDFDRLPTERGADATRTYRSVYHWHPLLNGYSGYAPPTYPLVSALVHALPDPPALRLLARMTGLRYVLVHSSELGARERAEWDPPSDAALTPVARDEADALYALRDPPAPDLLDAFVSDAPAAATLTGTPLEPLPAESRRPSVRLLSPAPATARRRLRFALPAEVRNASTLGPAWPALVAQSPYLVTVGTRWERPDGSLADHDDVAGRLPYDLPSGAGAAVLVGARTPDEPGSWRLRIGVVQDGEWLPGDSLSIPIEVR